MRYWLLFLLPFNLFLVNCTTVSQTSAATTSPAVSQLQSPQPTSSPPQFMISTVTESPAADLMPTRIPTPISSSPRSSVLRPINGNLSNQIADLERYMPKANSEQFVVPTETDIAIFASLMTHIEAGYPLKAAEIAGQQGYELVRYTDRGDDNAQSLLLRELKPIQHGWGLYAFRINPTNNIIIEAPHPIFDRRTPQIALNLYRILDAKALLVAGAHRRANIDGSADVAHNPISIFHTVHLVLTYSENSTVLQIHGFSTAKRPGFPQVILNSNQETFPAELNRLANVLGAEGLQVKICGVDGWQDLCGRTNSQLNSMEQGVFIHVELADSLRQENKALINAIIALDLLSENSSDAIQMQPPR